jgi:hypothetical protein
VKRLVIVVLIASALLAALLLPSNSRRVPEVTLPAEDRIRLDSLDATGVVREFFASGDNATELYLWPAAAERQSESNYVQNNERAGGVEDLTINGGELAPDRAGAEEGYGDLRLFTVEYRSLRESANGEPPGERFFFVYVGRYRGGPWRIESIGTGP